MTIIVFENNILITNKKKTKNDIMCRLLSVLYFDDITQYARTIKILIILYTNRFYNDKLNLLV